MSINTNKLNSAKNIKTKVASLKWLLKNYGLYPKGPANCKAAFNVEFSVEPFLEWKEENDDAVGGGGNIKVDPEAWFLWLSKLEFEKSNTYPVIVKKQKSCISCTDLANPI